MPHATRYFCGATAGDFHPRPLPRRSALTNWRRHEAYDFLLVIGPPGSVARLAGRPRRGPGCDHERGHRSRQGCAGRRHPGSDGERRAPAVREHLRGRHAGRRTFHDRRDAHRRSLYDHCRAVGISRRGEERRHAHAWRGAGPLVRAGARERRRDRDGHRRNEPGVQLDPYGRVDLDLARRAEGAADGLGPYQRHHTLDASVRRLGLVCRPGQPDEQHHGGWLLLQQLVRTRRTAGRPDGRGADFARSHRAGAGERRALRRAPGQLCRRRRQHRHAQRHQPFERLHLPPVPQRVVCRHRGTGARLQSRRLQHGHDRRVGRRPDRQEPAVCVWQLREAGRHPAVVDVPRERRRRDGGGQRHARPRVRPERDQRPALE